MQALFFQVQPFVLVVTMHICTKQKAPQPLRTLQLVWIPVWTIRFRPAQSGGLVLVAHEREQLLFLPAAGRPTMSRPLPELVPLVGPPTHNCCHRWCNFTMPPVYIKPLLPVKLNCNPSELYFTRLIWCFTKYRYWMRWGQLIVHTTTGTGAGSQCRRYNKPPGPFTFSSPGFIPYTEMLSFGTSLHQRTLIWYFINIGGRTRSIKKFKPKLLLLLTHFKTCSVTYQLT